MNFIKNWQDLLNEPYYLEEGKYVRKNPPITTFSNNTIMNPAIRTQAEAVSATRVQKYVIMSSGVNGDFSMSVSPTPQNSATEARAECQRLAKINPGKLFIFAKLSGGELVPANTLSI